VAEGKGRRHYDEERSGIRKSGAKSEPSGRVMVQIYRLRLPLSRPKGTSAWWAWVTAVASLGTVVDRRRDTGALPLVPWRRAGGSHRSSFPSRVYVAAVVSAVDCALLCHGFLQRMWR
jgi:hypothetical protein